MVGIRLSLQPPLQHLHKIRFTDVENAAWEQASFWTKRLSWQTQGERVKSPLELGG